jgi:hypothetical protein
VAQTVPRSGKTTYSYGELEGLWIGAGGPARLAPLMAAIAMAESGGRATARNPSGATGLWQILGQVSPGSLYDPHVNARNAVVKWKTQGLRAWVTYTSGAYKRWLRHGVAPVDPGGASGRFGIPYLNPLRQVRNLHPERIDMGVDYAGSGPVYALGPARVTAVSRAWAGGVGDVGPGTWITNRLTSGPAKGRQVYVAENVAPDVKPGQQVTAHTVLGRATGGIETGFAAPGPAGQRGETLAASLGQQSKSGDPGAEPTAAGVAFSDLLAATGAPRGVGPRTGGTGSTAPGWPPPWLVGILAGIDRATGGTGQAGAGAIPSALSGIATAISGISDWLNGLATAVDFLLNPANWVRILAGAGGGILVISGVVTLSHVGGSIPGTGLSARPAALPIGIVMVGAGGVLLFVAFHNLPGEPANIGELLGSLRDEAQGAAAGKAAA